MQGFRVFRNQDSGVFWNQDSGVFWNQDSGVFRNHDSGNAESQRVRIHEPTKINVRFQDLTLSRIYVTVWGSVKLRMRGTEQTECQAFSPVVRIGSHAPHRQVNVVSPFGSRGGGHTRFRKRRRGEPIQTKGQPLWYSGYSTRCTVCTMQGFRCSQIRSQDVLFVRAYLLKICNKIRGF
jgi:hypothetical protein